MTPKNFDKKIALLILLAFILIVFFMKAQTQSEYKSENKFSDKDKAPVIQTPVLNIVYQKSEDETIDYSQIKADPDALADMTINVWQDNIGRPFARIIYLEKDRQELENSLATGYQKSKVGDKEAYFITRLYGEEEIYTYFILESEQKAIKVIGYLPGPNTDKQEREQALQRFETILNTVRVAN